jgi:hypothetical protein
MLKEIRERMTQKYDALVETVKVALLLAFFAFLVAIS